MKVISGLSSLDKLRYPRLTLAIGNFDGVHRGHQKIISAILRRARYENGMAGLMTFRQHSRNVLSRNKRVCVLTPLMHKLALLEDSGIDLLFLENFTRDFARVSPECFLKNMLIGKLGVSTLCLGPDAHFGRGRRGNDQLARDLSRQGFLRLLKVGAARKFKTPVSSTRIRRLIQSGRFNGARRLLGRPYSFWGDVVSGKGRGRKIGFPTVNLKPQSEVMPPEGIYTAWIRSVECQLEPDRASEKTFILKKKYGKFYHALMSFGKRPTFEKYGKPTPEVHILGFEGSFKARTVEVVIGKRLRAEKKYASAALLCRQIELDVKNAKKWFNVNKNIS